MRASRAFTLVELLVVIAIIGILVALLLPAVQSAREAARRTQCANHLKQLGLAVLNYHGSRGYLPVNQTGSGELNGSDCEAGYYSWHTQVLPFLEETALHDSIDFDINMADACGSGAPISVSHPNAAAAAQVVAGFLCPSDPVPGSNEAVMGSANPASNSYAANAGWPSPATGYEGERPTPGPYNGVISLENRGAPASWHPKGRVRLCQVTDGTSHTAAVAERLIQTASSLDEIRNAPEKLKSYHVTASARTLPMLLERSSAGATHSDPIATAYLGRAWISGWAPAGPTYMHLNLPNTHHTHFETIDPHGDFAVAPTSNHPGGVQTLMLDGHVEFIRDGIEPAAWWALGSRDGGETDPS